MLHINVVNKRKRAKKKVFHILQAAKNAVSVYSFLQLPELAFNGREEKKN